MKTPTVSEIKLDEPLPGDFKVLDAHIRKLERYIKSEKESLKFLDELAYKKLLLIIDYYEELRMYERASIFEKTYKLAEFLIPLDSPK